MFGRRILTRTILMWTLGIAVGGAVLVWGGYEWAAMLKDINERTAH